MKVIIFNHSGHLLKRFNFYFNATSIEITNSYVYLGIQFTISGNFKSACDSVSDQAKEAPAE